MPATESFFDAYVTTALWSSNDDDGNPLDSNYDASNVSADTLASMRADCDAFYDANSADLNCDGVKFGPDFDQDGRGGHDFWLTRNGHGAGFWDGDWPEPMATRLTDAAHKFGEVDLFVNDGVISS